MGIEIFDLKKNGFFDERGWAVNPIPVKMLGNKSFGHIHITSIEPNAVRGNHYHENTIEFLSVFGGEYDFHYKEDGMEKSRHVPADELVGIKIDSGVTHAVKNIGNNTIYIMAYYDKPYDHENPDTVRDIIV
ncbi:MAG: hypothetical protein GF307_02970 [candidate division Zixibacteria bacterium]|nr:hypothetical protein [candidate division Zixibacteria bacterium]